MHSYRGRSWKSSSASSVNHVSTLARLMANTMPDDYFNVTVGHDASAEMPCFIGQEFTVTAHQANPTNEGYLFGMLVENPHYLNAVLRELNYIPKHMEKTSRLLVYLFLEEGDTQSHMIDTATTDDTRNVGARGVLQRDRLSAYVIDSDWLEKLGQSLTMAYHKLYPTTFASVMSTRHLHFEIPAKTLIAAGAAVRTKIVPIVGLDMQLIDQTKIVMDSRIQTIQDHTQMLKWCKNLSDDLEAQAQSQDVDTVIARIVSTMFTREGLSKEYSFSNVAKRWNQIIFNHKTQDADRVCNVSSSIQTRGGVPAGRMRAGLGMVTSSDVEIPGGLPRRLNVTIEPPTPRIGDGRDSDDSSQQIETQREEVMRSTLVTEHDLRRIAENIDLAEVTGRHLYNWRWQPTKVVGKCSVMPKQPVLGALLSPLAAAVHLSDSVAHYRASYSDFKFWSALEVACSLLVNLIFAFIG